MPDPVSNGELFLHVRVVVGVILGLSIGKLLAGLATFVEHPGRVNRWWVHLAWVFWALISVVGFWWWEFRLYEVGDWTFGRYLFIFAYTSGYYMICALLFPADINEYGGYEDYFISRRRWFFGLIALTYLLDIGDSLLKGSGYIIQLGTPYAVRVVVSIIACGFAALVTNRRFHAALVLAAIAYQLIFFFTYYNTLF